MNWVKTDAGQIEAQAQVHTQAQTQTRTQALLVQEPPQCDPLLASPASTSTIDTQALASTGLMTSPEPCCSGGAPGVSPQRDTVFAAVRWPLATGLPHSPTALDHEQLAATLIQLISTELGLRGFMLTIAVEKTRSNAELRSVAQRAIDQIRTHRGDAAAAAAQRTLDGA